jgi:cellulose biosynthesis protein BcsQ
MAKTIGVIQVKGGAGRSTLATNRVGRPVRQ